VATLLAENHECLAILSAEGGVITTAGGRYARGQAFLDTFNQAFSGDAIRVNRGSRPPVFLDNPCLTIGLCPQPDVLTQMKGDSEFRQRGFADRFLFALPVPNLGRRTLDGPPVPQGVRRDYCEVVRAMLEQDWCEGGEGRQSAHVLHLSREAAQLWRDFSHRTEAQMGEGGTLCHLQGWGGKLPGAVGRIAAVLHVARHAGDRPEGHEVAATDMEAALRLADALQRHALVAFDSMGMHPDLEGARAILSWLRRQGKPVFRRRDAQEAVKHRFTRRADLDGPLDVLIERDYVRRPPRPTKRSPGRPSETYEVNPAALS